MPDGYVRASHCLFLGTDDKTREEARSPLPAAPAFIRPAPCIQTLAQLTPQLTPLNQDSPSPLHPAHALLGPLAGPCVASEPLTHHG